MELKEFISEKEPWEYNFEFECGDEEYAKLDTFERYFTYKISPEITAYDNANKFIKKQCGYSPVYDPDGSGKGFYPIIHKIYNALWGWEKNSYNTFGKLKCGQDLCEFGADTMNSVQTALGLTIEPNRGNRRSFYWTLECWYSNKKNYEQIWKDMKADDYIDAYHTLGNFVLVPKWFNGDRGTKLYLCKDKETPGYAKSKKDGKYYKKIDDFWDLSLEYLNVNGFKKIKKSEVNFDKDNFNWNINYFFLWDYVNENVGSRRYEPKYIGIEEKGERDLKKFFIYSTKFIHRRGKFMTAMLMIQNDKQSDLYARIQDALFSKDDIWFGGIDKAAEEILKRFESEIPENAKNLLDELKDEFIDLRNE